MWGIINAIILCIPICACLILNIISLFVIKGYNDGVFNDFYNNWKQKPIYSIQIESNGEKLSLGKSLNNEDLFIWKGKTFYVLRQKTDYFEAYNIGKKNLDLKLCGIDSNGNYLYFESCPINYIEFSSNSNPYISKEEYEVQTIQIDNSTYLHYSNNFINGKILIDLHVSDYYGPCSNTKKKDICAFYDNCNDKCSSKESIIDISYFNLDNEEYNKFADDNKLEKNKRDVDNLDLIYLYGRTYISSNNVNNDFDKVDDHIKIKDLKNKIMIYRIKNCIIVLLIFVFLIYILIIGAFQIPYINTIPFIIGIIAFIGQIVCIYLEFKIREYEKNIQGKYLKYIYHQVSEDYSKNKPFLQINYSLLFIYFINLLFLIITICIYENNQNSTYGWKNLVDTEDAGMGQNEISTTHSADQTQHRGNGTSPTNKEEDQSYDIGKIEEGIKDIYSKYLGDPKKGKDFFKKEQIGIFICKLKMEGIISLFRKIQKKEIEIDSIDFEQLKEFCKNI